MIPKRIYNIETISIKTLIHLPAGKFSGIYLVHDMGGNERTAIRWLFRDREFGDLRKSFFDLNNGEYLGEAM